MTAAAKRHMSRVAELPCVVCGTEPVELHHIRDGQGMAQRAPDTLVVALCPECHRGPRGIHGDRSTMRLLKLSELDLLARTLEALA